MKKLLWLIPILLIVLLIKMLFMYFFYPELVKINALKYQLPKSLIYAVIFEESKFRKNVVSKKGAVGLMQIMPKTAKEIARDFKIENYFLNSPDYNITFGSYYLRKLMSKYRQDLVLSLAAYNAGPGVVDGWLKAKNQSYLLVSDIPYPETRKYVEHILKYFGILVKVVN